MIPRLGVLVVLVVVACTRNRTPAMPGLEVTTGKTKVRGIAMIGQPLTLTADWSGTCEYYALGNSNGEHDPGEGEWHPTTCNQVTSFELDVTCSLPCTVGKQDTDVNFHVSREVIPLQAGKMKLDIKYKSPWHQDKQLTYDLTVYAPKNVMLRGCGNQKRIPLDAILFAPPGGMVPTLPIRCVKVDPEAEGSLRVDAVTTDEQEHAMPIEIGFPFATVMQLPMDELEKLFGEPSEDGVYPVLIQVMGKPLIVHIDVRGRIKR